MFVENVDVVVVHSFSPFRTDLQFNDTLSNYFAYESNPPVSHELCVWDGICVNR